MTFQFIAAEGDDWMARHSRAVSVSDAAGWFGYEAGPRHDAANFSSVVHMMGPHGQTHDAVVVCDQRNAVGQPPATTLGCSAWLAPSLIDERIEGVHDVTL